MNPKIFLAATSHVKSPIVPYYKPHYILESFMDIKSNTKVTNEYVRWCLTADMFLLDSGAFAFMNKQRKARPITETDMHDYLESYIAFINKWDIQYFFELDLDCIYDYEMVKKIRHYIEQETKKKCIPVWHLSRGKEEWVNMCQEYDYVAIGGMASKEIKIKSDFNLLCELCDIAHSYGCKVHGLGFMSIDKLNDRTCPFDTVDGTSWQGHMRAQTFVLEENKIRKIVDVDRKNGTRTWKDSANECFNVWTKFSKIVDKERGNYE